MRGLIVIDPGVEVKSIEGYAARADRYLRKRRAHLGVEAIAVHAEIARRVAVTDEARKNCHCRLHLVRIFTGACKAARFAGVRPM